MAVLAVNSIITPAMPAQFLAMNLEHGTTEVMLTEFVETNVAGPKTLEDMIREMARERGLDEDKIIFVARCESKLSHSALGDGHMICASTKKPMRSRGLWQINECGHPEISDEQAFDPIWSTDWAMDVFAKGNEEKEWKICSRKYDRLVAAGK